MIGMPSDRRLHAGQSQDGLPRHGFAAGDPVVRYFIFSTGCTIIIRPDKAIVAMAKPKAKMRHKTALGLASGWIFWGVFAFYPRQT
jgi:hypothetical protein